MVAVGIGWTSLRHRGDRDPVGRDRRCDPGRQRRPPRRLPRGPRQGDRLQGTFTLDPGGDPSSRAPRTCRATRSRRPSASRTRAGIPRPPDADLLAGRGMAVKFHLPDGEATDIVSVPLVVFFVRNARGLPGDDAGPDPRPGDRAARSGEAGRLPRRAPRDRGRAPEGHAQAGPDDQLRHLRLPGAPRFRPGRRRGREALGPLHLGAGGGDRVPDRRGAGRRGPATTCRRRSGSG